MNHQYYNVIGVMSGTSLDGIDIAHIELNFSDTWKFKIKQAQCIPYPNDILKELKEAILYNDEELDAFNLKYTTYLASIINSFIATYEVENILAICSHGHTIKHQPEKGFTMQIGNIKEIATLTNHRVICDFRTADVALGGQGAPLVPIGDQLLFNNYDYCINLGGFANVSFEEKGVRIAYDICPVNVVLNKYALLLGKDFDEGGAFAKAGTINYSVLQNLNKLDYYQSKPPKSLGVEWVAHHIFPLLSAIENPMDVLATFTEHAAIQIAKNLKNKSTALCTGGGSYNKFLLQRIRTLTSCNITVPEGELVEYKEALIFGLLGVLRLRNANNCLSSVTGAKFNHSSGVIFIP